MTTHINWSGHPDWLSARATLRSLNLGATLYGNFADVEMEAAELAKKLSPYFDIDASGNPYPYKALLRLS